MNNTTIRRLNPAIFLRAAELMENDGSFSQFSCIALAVAKREINPAAQDERGFGDSPEREFYKKLFGIRGFLASFNDMLDCTYLTEKLGKDRVFLRKFRVMALLLAYEIVRSTKAKKKF